MKAAHVQKNLLHHWGIHFIRLWWRGKTHPSRGSPGNRRLKVQSSVFASCFCSHCTLSTCGCCCGCCCCCCCLSFLPWYQNTLSLGSQHGLKTSGSQGLLQTFSSKQDCWDTHLGLVQTLLLIFCSPLSFTINHLHTGSPIFPFHFLISHCDLNKSSEEEPWCSLNVIYSVFSFLYKMNYSVPLNSIST